MARLTSSGLVDGEARRCPESDDPAPELRRRPVEVRPGETSAWTIDLDTGTRHVLEQHRVRGACVLPGSFALEAMLVCASDASDGAAAVVSGAAFLRLCVLRAQRRSRFRVGLSGPRERATSATVSYEEDLAEREDRAGPPFAVAAVCRRPTVGEPPPGAVARAEQLRGRRGEETPERLYATLRARGNDYGPAFRRIVRAWRSSREAVAEIRGDPAGSDRVRTWASPLVIDAGVQLLAAAADLNGTYLWAGGDRISWSGAAPPRDLVGYARVRAGASEHEVAGDVFLLGPAGELVAELTGARLHVRRGRMR